jgi:hypothetical protein
MTRIAWLAPLVALAACGESEESARRAADAPLATAAAGPASALPGTKRASIFTRLDDQGCGPERVVEETGDWDRRCEGAGGYALEWGSGDLREDLAVIAGGKRTNLELPAKVAGGAFDALGKTVEWRGPAGSMQDVLVVRVHVADADGKNDSGRLAIARLGGSPCVVAVVPVGAGQSERARRIADGKLPDCLAD